MEVAKARDGACATPMFGMLLFQSWAMSQSTISAIFPQEVAAMSRVNQKLLTQACCARIEVHGSINLSVDHCSIWGSFVLWAGSMRQLSNLAQVDPISCLPTILLQRAQQRLQCTQSTWYSGTW